MASSSSRGPLRLVALVLLLASAGCPPPSGTQGSGTTNELWTIQLDDTTGAIPGRIWLLASASVRDDPAQAACLGDTVTTVIATFSLVRSRVNTSEATGSARGSSTQGTTCNAFSMTLSPTGDADIVLTGPGLLTTVVDSGYGFGESPEAQAWRKATWTWGTRSGNAYVYRKRLAYLPDSHFTLQLQLQDNRDLGTLLTKVDGSESGKADTWAGFSIYFDAGTPVLYLDRFFSEKDDDMHIWVWQNDAGIPPNFPTVAETYCRRRFDGPDQVDAVITATGLAGGSFSARCSTGWGTYSRYQLTATAVSTSEIDLTWLNLFPNLAELKLARKVDQSSYALIATFTSAGGIPTAYQDTGLAPGTTYTYSLTMTDTMGAQDGAWTWAATLSAGPAVDVGAASLVVGQNGDAQLVCAARGGVGPYTYQWRGYRDDGAGCATGPCVFSDTAVAQPTVRLVFPTEDFHFYCDATDTGVPPSDPNRTISGHVKLSESDGPVGRFTVAAGPFHLGVDDVSFNAQASTDLVMPVSWTIERYTGTRTPAPGLEGFLLLYDPLTVVWAQVVQSDTSVLAATFPAATFPQAGIYRARLDVYDAAFNSHSTHQYFTILP